MGVLKDVASGKQVALSAEFVVGRSSAHPLQLDDPRVSSQHALLRWSDGHWSIRDLGSRNGTSVDDVILEPGRPLRLARGAVLSFGGPRQRWRLIHDGPPIAMAHCPADSVTIQAEDGLLGIPNSEGPEATVYCDENGDWIVEHGEEMHAAADQAQLQLRNGDEWTLWLPQAGEGIDTTRASSGVPPVLRLMTLRFRVSRNEEYIELDIFDGHESKALRPRSHHEMLLVLARARLADKDQPSLGPAERGWVYTDELCKMIGCDSDLLNIYVFRARKQVTQAGVENGGEIIQRRPTSRQLRLGTERIEITGLS